MYIAKWKNGSPILGKMIEQRWSDFISGFQSDSLGLRRRDQEIYQNCSDMKIN